MKIYGHSYWMAPFWVLITLSWSFGYQIKSILTPSSIDKSAARALASLTADSRFGVEGGPGAGIWFFTALDDKGAAGAWLKVVIP